LFSPRIETIPSTDKQLLAGGKTFCSLYTFPFICFLKPQCAQIETVLSIDIVIEDELSASV
jgi:hypothetical protein